MSKADSVKARLRALAVQGEKPYEYKNSGDGVFRP